MQLSPHTPQKLSPGAGGVGVQNPASDMAALAQQLQSMVGKHSVSEMSAANFYTQDQIGMQDR